MITRLEYLDKLKLFKDKDLIKVVTGIRRCGKSTLFKQFQEYLELVGVKKNQIIVINFEDLDNEHLLEYGTLYKSIKQKIIAKEKMYIFLDEIQLVPQFQRVVDSLYLNKMLDIYITGSNAAILSGELATLLSGRYVEIEMLPLSLKEYLTYFDDSYQVAEKYRKYLVDSSFPYTIYLEGNRQLIREYLGGIYNTVILKDVVARRRINDVYMLESVIKFMFDNIGNLCSIKKISDTMNSSGRKISPPTIESYLSALVDSFILYRVGRYDVKGKEYLKTGEKYYVVDIGLRYYLLGNKGGDLGHILENVVYLELRRRGYEIYVGKIGVQEIDFICMNEEGVSYYQVAATVRDGKTLQRELAPLYMVNDHYAKYLLTLDEDPEELYDGIKKINVLDWLVQ